VSDERDISTDWRTLLEALIDASWEDSRRSREHQLSGSESQLLETYGDESLRSGLDAAVNTMRDRTTLSERPKYYLYQESAERVIVEVAAREDLQVGANVPRLPFRVYLVWGQRGWRVTEILIACTSCNPLAAVEWDLPPSLSQPRTPGKCHLCSGTGSQLSFLSGKETGRTCASCGGTGKCLYCGDEPEPGWKRCFSLRGLGLKLAWKPARWRKSERDRNRRNLE
jgi:hypothetical protein